MMHRERCPKCGEIIEVRPELFPEFQDLTTERNSLAEQLRAAREALEDADFALYRAIFPDSDGADYRRCIGARPKVQAALAPPSAPAVEKGE